jgi:multicomponent Na+:H+ antiporter subunit E
MISALSALAQAIFTPLAARFDSGSARRGRAPRRVPGVAKVVFSGWCTAEGWTYYTPGRLLREQATPTGLWSSARPGRCATTTAVPRETLMSLRPVVSFVVLCAIWLLWSGLTVELGADGVKVNWLLAGFGLGSCLLVTWLSQRLQVLDPESQPFHLSWQIISFLTWLAREVWTSNVAVARVVLARRIVIRPLLVRVPASQRSSIGQVIHANTITLTPGTLTLDLRDGELLVHALTDSLLSAQDSRTIDQRILRLEAGQLEAGKLEGKGGGSR